MQGIIRLFLCAAFAMCARAAELTIVQTTDVHGSIEEQGKPGILRIVSGIEALRAERGENAVLWIDCGDLTQGSFHATFDQGDSMIRGLSDAKCDAWIPGNHDFDYGPAVLIRHIRAFSGEVVAANLKLRGAEVAPWRMFERGGMRVAVIGIVPPYLDQWIPEHALRGVETEDPETAIDRIMPEIMEQKPDWIVLGIHMGEFAAGRLHRRDGKRFSLASLSSRFPQIDLILAGHSHMTCPGKSFAGGAWFVQAPPHGEGFAVVVCRKDADGNADFASWVNGAERETESKTVQSAFCETRAAASGIRDRIVATLPFPLSPMKSSDQRCRLAELLAESMAARTGAEGAFSSTLCGFATKPGAITEYDLFRLVPYENEVILLSLTESQLEAIRAEQKETPFSESRMIERLNPDASRSEAGERKLYAFGSFAASGAGGRFPVLAAIAKRADVRKQATGVFVRDCLREYLKRNHGE